MRRAQRSILLAFAFLAMSMLTAANTVSLTVTPNPAPPPSANKLKGDGTYNVDPGFMLGGIRFDVFLKGTGQVTSLNASTNQGKWDATLQVAPGTYNPSQVVMTVIDAKMKASTIAVIDNKDQVVK